MCNKGQQRDYCISKFSSSVQKLVHACIFAATLLSLNSCCEGFCSSSFCSVVANPITTKHNSLLIFNRKSLTSSSSNKFRQQHAATVLNSGKRLFKTTKHLTSKILGKRKTKKNPADEDIDFQKVSFRLDGLEIYVLVSAISSSAAYDTMNEIIYNGGAQDLPSLFDNSILGCAFVSTITGVYSTLVFSLCVLYSKTALGRAGNNYNKDFAIYEKFMNETSKQRINGFQAFCTSISFFLLQAIFLVSHQAPEPFKWPVGIILTAMIYLVVVRDVKNIIDIAASTVFPMSSISNNNETEDNENENRIYTAADTTSLE